MDYIGKMWIKRNYPYGSSKYVHSKELLFIKSLRHVVYYTTQTGIKKLGDILEGGI